MELNKEETKGEVPTPGHVKLRRHFSKQRQTHQRDAHDGVPNIPLPLAEPGVYEGDPTCFIAGSEYTSARCCDTSKGPTGDASCWGGGYDFPRCCPQTMPQRPPLVFAKQPVPQRAPWKGTNWVVPQRAPWEGTHRVYPPSTTKGITEDKVTTETPIPSQQRRTRSWTHTHTQPDNPPIQEAAPAQTWEAAPAQTWEEREQQASAEVKHRGRDATKEREELESELESWRIANINKQIQSCCKECESRLKAGSKGKTKKRKRNKKKKKKKKSAERSAHRRRRRTSHHPAV
jgi:hypothetical protein